MRYVWIALALQLCGYVFDALWHGVIQPGVEPTTVGDMVTHLVTVHLPLYVGAVAVLVTTVAASRRRRVASLGVVVAGAALSVAAEAWHAASHLRLDTHTARSRASRPSSGLPPPWARWP
jgi:hypothetical protein